MNVARCANAVNGISTAVTVNSVRGSRCCSLCCSWLNLQFLKTAEGLLKLGEIVSGAVCQKLLLGYGFTYSTSLGSSYYNFLTTASASLLTSLILLLCYLVSQRSFQQVRQSLFEIIFNGIASFLYLSSSCYLVFAIYTFLYPIYKISSIFQVYPEMCVTYIAGFTAGSLHGYDSYLAYKYYITTH